MDLSAQHRLNLGVYYNFVCLYRLYVFSPLVKMCWKENYVYFRTRLMGQVATFFRPIPKTLGAF